MRRVLWQAVLLAVVLVGWGQPAAAGRPPQDSWIQEAVPAAPEGFPVQVGAVVTPMAYKGNESQLRVPVVSGENAAVVARINEVLSYRKLVGEAVAETVANYGDCGCGIVAVDFRVNLQRGHILDLTVVVEGIGAYPDWAYLGFTFDVRTGALMTAADLFCACCLEQVATAADAKLQQNIATALAATDERYRQEQGRMLTDHHFTVEHLERFTVTGAGIEFEYEFDFAHAIAALEPEETVMFSYAELEPYLRELGQP